MRQDPIVEEVRKHRREIELECNEDFSTLFRKAKLNKTLNNISRSIKSKKNRKDKAKIR